MEMKPQTLWAGVAIIGILVAGEVTLSLNNRPTEVMLTLAGLIALPLLGLGGATLYSQNAKSIEQSNGNIKRLQDELTASHAREVELARQLIPQIPSQRPIEQPAQATIILPGE